MKSTGVGGAPTSYHSTWKLRLPSLALNFLSPFLLKYCYTHQNFYDIPMVRYVCYVVSMDAPLAGNTSVNTHFLQIQNPQACQRSLFLNYIHPYLTIIYTHQDWQLSKHSQHRHPEQQRTTRWKFLSHNSQLHVRSSFSTFPTSISMELAPRNRTARFSKSHTQGLRGSVAKP